MKKLVALAVKNILRNRRRSIITATAIGFGAFIMLNALGYIAGLNRAMVDVVLQTGIGHVEVHHRGYLQALEDRMASSEFVVQEGEVDALLASEAVRGQVEKVAKRVVFPGLLGDGENMTNALVMGIHPDVERSFFGDLTVTQGRYLGAADERGILVSERVRRVFSLEAGDTVSIAVQTSRGAFQTAAFTVTGVFDLGTPFNFRYAVDALIPIREAQRLVASDGLTEVALLLRDVRATDSVVSALREAAAGSSLEVEVHGWQYIGRLLLNIATYMEMGMRGWTTLIFVGIALAILNTFLMSVYERTQEIGILRAIGMKQRRILGLFLLETLCLSLCAFLVALVASAASMAVLSAIGLPGLFLDFLPKGEAVHPWIQPADALICLVTTVGISTLAGLFPAWRASRTDPVEALRYE